MKNLIQKSAFTLIVFALVMSISSCCEKCDHMEIVEIKGTASISQNTVKNGDVVYLSIDPILESTIKTIEGSNIMIDFNINMLIHSCDDGVITYNPSPNVLYYVDGVEVGQSMWSMYSFFYKYEVKGLSVGEHTLSARATPRSEYVIFNGKYTDTKFTVVSD